MNARDFILYRTQTLHIAAAGMAALVMCFVSLAVYAEPALKKTALIEQENVKW